MKKRIAILFVIGILIVLCGCGKVGSVIESAVGSSELDAIGGSKVEGSGFDSAEKAALAYAEALQKGDVKEILSTYAVETYVEHYDLEKYIESIYSYSLGAEVSLDNADAYTTELNLISRQYKITRNLTYMYLFLGELEDYNTVIPVNGDPYADASDFMEDLVIDNWTDVLAAMRIGIVRNDDELLPENMVENNKKNLDRQAAYLNCDELTALAIEVNIDGNDYYLCVDVACYDGKWYVCNALGSIGILLGADSLCGGLLPR